MNNIIFSTNENNIIDNATKKMKNASQDPEAKAETAKDHVEEKPSSDTLNKTKIKMNDALE
ncbi:hypothetical protein [Candidatus Nitrosocosmicus hydrocola]|uniref:hypothetical protein n=1 Tax=Candidatus Nitrosocosmicus hydrocola TaxID=1826872 RepID=UPI0011E5AB91|nr:hypothetical protein [Candidatus Nitrosocosmicus hydrocola]